MEAEEKKLVLDETDDALLEEVSGGHIAIHGVPGKAYKLYCWFCGSPNLRFVRKFRDVNSRLDGTGNFEVNNSKLIGMYISENKWPPQCLNCGAKFPSKDARWFDNVEWNPNDCSD